MCVSASGIDFEKLPPVTDNGILMEWPYVRGGVDNESLQEIDNIILSVKGLRLR